MRLTEHLENINEKVKKNEIDAALANSNILVGAEFEFLHNELKAQLAAYEVAWESALDDYDDYDKDYKAWKEWTKEIVDKRVKLEDEILKYIDDQDSPMFKELDDALKDIEDAENDIDNDAPYMGEDYYKYFKLLGDSQPSQKGFPEVKDFVAPVRPGDDEFLFAQWKSIVEKLDWKGAPFKPSEAVIGFYGEIDTGVGTKKWAVENDAHIGVTGIEIKNPPMPITQFMPKLEQMLNYIKKVGTTDSRTSIHINMSIKGIPNLSERIDPIKLIMFTNEEFIWKTFTDRRNNPYTASIRDKVNREGLPTKEELFHVMNGRKLQTKAAVEKFDSINFSNIHGETGRVEFRQMGGAGYEKKLNDIRKVVGEFSHNLSLAVDETYKKKEYIKKLQRVFNKLEIFKLELKEKLLKHAIELDKNEISFKKDLKSVINNLKKLKSIYKISPKERKAIESNKEYYRSMEAEVADEFRKEHDTEII